MNKQLGVRMFSTIGAKSYKAYKAPEFWRASSHYMRAGNKNWHRYYHDRNSFGSYGPWAWKGYHHHHHGHRRGGFFGYLFVGLIGFWFGYHTDSKDWRRHHQERLERFHKNKEEWNKEWNNAEWGFGRKRQEQPQLEQPQDDNSMKSLPDQSSSDHGTNYGLWKS